MRNLTEKQKEMLKTCKYFKGEEECPYEDFPEGWFWDMERVYTESDESDFNEMGGLYKNHKFRQFDMPETLLYVMFTSWAKQEMYYDESIPHFYDLVEKYLSK